MNASRRPPSPNTRRYLAVGREGTLPYYLEVARRIAASFLSRSQKKGAKTRQDNVPRSLGPGTLQVANPAIALSPSPALTPGT